MSAQQDDEMTRALISDQSIARGLAIASADEDPAQVSTRSLISDESIANGLGKDFLLVQRRDRDAYKMDPISDGDSDGDYEAAAPVQGELFLDSDFESDIEDKHNEFLQNQQHPSMYELAKISIANARIKRLNRMMISAKFARLTTILLAKHPRIEEKPPASVSSSAASLTRIGSTIMPRITDDTSILESDLFSSDLSDPQSLINGLSAVTEAELSLIAKCQHSTGPRNDEE